MRTPVLTRRAAIIGASAAGAGIAAATASPLPADPIFAAIERHRAAWARFSAECWRSDDVEAARNGYALTDEDAAIYEAASDAEVAAALALFATTPTTLAGLRAGLAYVAADFDKLDTTEGSQTFIATLAACPALGA